MRYHLAALVSLGLMGGAVMFAMTDHLFLSLVLGGFGALLYGGLMQGLISGHTMAGTGFEGGKYSLNDILVFADGVAPEPFLDFDVWLAGPDGIMPCSGVFSAKQGDRRILVLERAEYSEEV